MNLYTQILAVVYALGAFLHLLDILNLRLNFSAMSIDWKLWIVYLFIADTIASYMLWQKRETGERLFVFIATSQLFAFTFFAHYFGNQNFLVFFHGVTLTIYAALKLDIYYKARG